jgi:ribosome-associated translation inhibitor RaiA
VALARAMQRCRGMQVPLEITYRGIEPTESLDARIADWVEKLERVYARIVRCEVFVETPHRHHRHGRQFSVHVRLTIPNNELVVSHDPGVDGAHRDPCVAVRDAFVAARRQLEDHVARMR